MVPYLGRGDTIHTMLQVFSSFLLGAEQQLLQRVDVRHLLEQRVPPSVVSLGWRGHAAAAAVTGL